MGLEKDIKAGFGFALKDFESVSASGVPYVNDHLDELGGEEYVYSRYVRAGAILAWARHPILGARTLAAHYKQRKQSDAAR
jgi:hypothetical protein